jgi:hypothetical protein
MNYIAIEQAMKAEIADPKNCYMPNSPGAFVRDRLFKDCLWEEASWFWGCYCRGGFGIVSLDNLMLQLNELDKSTMPEWGTKGT